jgi:hypothetical protein
MLSLQQNLQIKKSLQTLEQTFVALEQHGIKSINFVNWLTTKGEQALVNNQFDEAVQIWLDESFGSYVKELGKTGLNWSLAGGAFGGATGLGAIPLGIVGGLGAMGVKGAYDLWKSPYLHNLRHKVADFVDPEGAVAPVNPYASVKQDLQNHAHEAAMALSELSHRIQKSKAMQTLFGDKDKVGQLGMLLMSLIHTIQNKLTEAGRPRLDVLLESVEDLRHENDIHAALVDLQELGFNPEEVVDTFIQQRLALGESWFSNLRSSWQNWYNTHKQKQVDADMRRDQYALTNALQKLKELDFQIQNHELKPSKVFLSLVQDFRKLAHDALGHSEPEPAPPPAPQPKPAPQPSAGTDTSPAIV